MKHFLYLALAASTLFPHSILASEAVHVGAKLGAVTYTTTDYTVNTNIVMLHIEREFIEDLSLNLHWGFGLKEERTHYNTLHSSAVVTTNISNISSILAKYTPVSGRVGSVYALGGASLTRIDSRLSVLTHESTYSDSKGAMSIGAGGSINISRNNTINIEYIHYFLNTVSDLSTITVGLAARF